MELHAFVGEQEIVVSSLNMQPQIIFMGLWDKVLSEMGGNLDANFENFTWMIVRFFACRHYGIFCEFFPPTNEQTMHKPCMAQKVGSPSNTRSIPIIQEAVLGVDEIRLESHKNMKRYKSRAKICRISQTNSKFHSLQPWYADPSLDIKPLPNAALLWKNAVWPYGCCQISPSEKRIFLV